jgi:Protein of unknown function (DUF992)
MTKWKPVSRSLMGAAVLTIATGLSAQAQPAGKVGVLECRISGGVGFIITSEKGLGCKFRPSHGPTELYYGTIRKIGIDIGATGPGRLVWAVLAPSRPGPGALAGDYVGASGSVSVGAGVGANALIGGLNNSFTLQPLSVQVQTGVNIAAGIGAITLSSSPR